MSSSNSDSNEGPKAILSGDERKMLREGGDLDITDQARWKRYSRIRERLRWAVYDFKLLYDNWDELNLDKTFAEGKTHPIKMMDGSSRAVSTLYRALHDGQISFESQLVDGVARAESDMSDRRVDVRFAVDPIVPGDVYVNDAAERINPDDVDALRIPEMRAVLEGLAHSDEDVAELVKEGRKKIHENESA